MILTFLLFLLFPIMYLSLVHDRNRHLFVCLFLINFILMGFNYENPDIGEYIRMFEEYNNFDNVNLLTTLDIGNISLILFGKGIGIASYEEYRFFYTLVILSLFIFSIYKRCYRYNYRTNENNSDKNKTNNDAK